MREFIQHTSLKFEVLNNKFKVFEQKEGKM